MPAVPGEVIAVPAARRISFYLAIERASDTRHEPLLAELISNCRSGVPELMSTQTLMPGNTKTRWVLQPQAGADGRSCYAGARVRKPVANGPDLLAYTNPVCIIVE